MKMKKFAAMMLAGVLATTTMGMGVSPIYLLGNFRLGVENTGIAYDTFDVRPNPGDLKGFHGKVPVPGGCVSVSVDPEEIRVYSDIPGGTLYVDGATYPLEAKKECRVKRK